MRVRAGLMRAGALGPLLAGVLLLAAGCSLLPSSVSRPAAPEPTSEPAVPQRVVFVGPGWDVGTVQRDGSGPRTIVAPSEPGEEPGDPSAPNEPLDGVPVAFVEGRAGVGAVRAALAYTWPTWSPDGRRVALSRIPGPDAGQIAALVVLDADGSNERFIHTTSDGLVNFVADGVPHYAYWSPDGRRLSFVAPTADATRLGLFETAMASADPYLVAEDAPLYHAWSPDSSAILVHRGAQLSVYSVGRRSPTEVIGRDSASYRMPAYSASGTWIAYVAEAGGGEQLIASSLEDGAERELWALDGAVAFAWSPREDVLAATQRPGPSSPDRGGIVLIDAASAERRRIFDGSVVAFFWSPDGSRIAIVSPGPDGDALRWIVVDVDTGAATEPMPFAPAPEYRIFLQFFDQFAPSHLVWSADSRYLVFAGAVFPENETRPEAWVVDVTGVEEPRALAAARLAFWVPPLAP